MPQTDARPVPTEAYVPREERHCRCDIDHGQHCSVCPRHTSAVWPEYGDGGPGDPEVAEAKTEQEYVQINLAVLVPREGWTETAARLEAALSTNPAVASWSSAYGADQLPHTPPLGEHGRG